ncbi:CIA30 family protein [Ningiella sp. W23]|uniref:CIA30 family protein n=1 Tax=Ningiella sp. W23 TaxID=3023715 RepID=UPI003756CA18
MLSPNSENPALIQNTMRFGEKTMVVSKSAKPVIKRVMLVLVVFAFSAECVAASMDTVVDDFSHADNSSLSIPRHFYTDAATGGKTSVEYLASDGIMTINGQISPPRGQPGWASMVLLLDENGKAKDLSAFEGIHLRLKVVEGMISITANSVEITNFDYHAAIVVARADGEFHDVTIPFSSMKRMWSEQIPLNTSTVNSLSIVAAGGQAMPFEYVLDEIRFY